MQTTENIIYSEKQKISNGSLSKIIIPPVLVMICMGIGMIYFGLQGVAYIFIPFGVLFILFFFLAYKTMWLSVVFTKTGLTYILFAFKKSQGLIKWEEIKSVQIVQYPKTMSQYGKQYITHGEGFMMTEKRIGLEIILKNGKKKFFTALEPEEMIKSVRRLDPEIQIIK